MRGPRTSTPGRKKIASRDYIRLIFPASSLYCRLTSRLGRRPDQPASRARWFPERGCGSARSKRSGVDPPASEGFLLALPSTSETDGKEARLATLASNASRNRSGHARKARQALASCLSVAPDPRSRRPMARLHPAFRRGCANQSQDARRGPEAVLLRPRPTRFACPRALKRTASGPHRGPGAVLRWPGPATPDYRIDNAGPVFLPPSTIMAGRGENPLHPVEIDLPAKSSPCRIHEVAGPWPGCARRFAGGERRHTMDTRPGPEMAPTGTCPTRDACPQVPDGAISGPSRGPVVILRWPGPATPRGGWA